MPVSIWMRVWRLEQKSFLREAFSGHGAALYPGRWNLPGQPAAYCSGTISLAALEILVNMSPEEMKVMEFYSVHAKIPDEVVKRMKILTIDRAGKISKEWRSTPCPEETRIYGGKWLDDKSSLIMRVPSAVVPQEDNYLINPRHPDFSKVDIGRPERFIFDARLLI